MPSIPRAYWGKEDMARMVALAGAWPAENVHVADLPYRLCSWALDKTENVCLWDDERQRLRAWAVLQAPFWTLDYCIHPDAPEKLLPEVLRWADDRANVLSGSPQGHRIWFAEVFEAQVQRREVLEALGFASPAQIGASASCQVLMSRPARLAVPEVPALAGYTIRPLKGLEEIEAYVALHRAVFESKNMTLAWRRRVLQHPAYEPELDLVALDSEGQLAAFCIGWYTPGGFMSVPSGQIEPLGVRADVRRQGLGHAILAQALRQLYRQGAEQVVVETDTDRHAVINLYEALGFRDSQNVLVYRKDYARARG